MIKIRLSRTGRKLSPVYTIVATDSRNARDAGKYLAKLGYFNPKAKEQLSNLNLDTIKTWLGKGAELSDTVRTIFKANNVKL